MSAPWLKFYPTDWRADPALRSCSIAARGLWIEMLCIMHEAEPYGSLLIKGQRIDKKRLASLCGISEKECVSLLMELESFGVFEREQNGTIYSRRMRRDAEKALKDKANGKLGGNPKVKEGVNPPVNAEVKAQIPEARSQNQKEKDTREAALFAAMQAFWSIWPNKVGKPAALKALRSAIDRATISEICEGVENYIRDKPPDRPWLNPATFLNQNRWEDRPAAVGTANGKTGNVSAATDKLVELVKQGFGRAAPEDGLGRGTDETDARLLSYRRG